MRVSFNIDLGHDHFTSSDCFGLSIPTGVLKISTPIIDTFESQVLFLSHSQYKKDVDEVDQAQCRTATMAGAGVLALQGGTGGSGLVQPGEGVVLGGPNSSPWYLRGQHQGNGDGFFIAIHGWRMRNNRH